MPSEQLAMRDANGTSSVTHCCCSFQTRRASGTTTGCKAQSGRQSGQDIGPGVRRATLGIVIAGSSFKRPIKTYRDWNIPNAGIQTHPRQASARVPFHVIEPSIGFSQRVLAPCRHRLKLRATSLRLTQMMSADRNIASGPSRTANREKGLTAALIDAVNAPASQVVTRASGHENTCTLGSRQPRRPRRTAHCPARRCCRHSRGATRPSEQGR